MEHCRKPLAARQGASTSFRRVERVRSRIAFVAFLLMGTWVWPTPGRSNAHPIDAARSTLTVYVYKTGFLSPLAHDHEIEVPIQSGEVGESGDSVELRVSANTLRVLDAGASEGTKAKIQETMKSAQVLDVDHFPEIQFVSSRIEPMGSNHWVVRGSLDLHGQTRPVSFEVFLKDGLYQGTATLRQTEFGITPVKIACGTVRVKDEVKVGFSIALTQSRETRVFFRQGPAPPDCRLTRLVEGSSNN